MRLLNCRTLKFQDFDEKNIPRYLILSHRWSTWGEVTHKDFHKGRQKTLSGYEKIISFCKFTCGRTLGLDSRFYDWVWIDSCCIDKRSSAELSEAINSMYRWYERADECIVYLADVSALDARREVVELRFRSSEWFTRGWTLQEVLAPTIVVFCSCEWEVIGHKCHALDPSECFHDKGDYGPLLTESIAAVTGIQLPYLANPDWIQHASIARRMSWAADRVTTRVEDLAYCLLGIFQVTMPLLYGEGAFAFQRLQEELIRRSNDHSVFAWISGDHSYNRYSGLLAPSPKHFKACECIEYCRQEAPMEVSLTNRGIKLRCKPISISQEMTLGDRTCIMTPKAGDSMQLPLTKARKSDEVTMYFIELNCKRTLPTPDQPGRVQSKAQRQDPTPGSGTELSKPGTIKRSLIHAGVGRCVLILVRGRRDETYIRFSPALSIDAHTLGFDLASASLATEDKVFTVQRTLNIDTTSELHHDQAMDPDFGSQEATRSWLHHPSP